MKAVNLKCEYLKNPLGIDCERPRIFWNCEGGVTQTATQAISVSAPSGIYGVLWNGGSNPVLSRTDDSANFADPHAEREGVTGTSPFDTIYPWSGMNIVEDNNAGTMVSIPKFYYKWTRSGSGMKLQISGSSFTGSHVSPAHADRGDGSGERDIVYVARYLCSDTSYKSATGATTSNQNSVAHADMRAGVALLGNNIYSWDFAMYWTIAMLYLVEYANWNTKSTIGSGGSPQNTTGATTAMAYHTGSTGNGGWADTQYRHIENLWGAYLTFIDGISFSGANIYVIKNPNDFATFSNKVLVGERELDSESSSGALIKGFTDPSAVDGFEYALYPNSVATIATNQYVTDETWNRTSSTALRGCYATQTNVKGLFSVYSCDQQGGAFRIMKLP